MTINTHYAYSCSFICISLASELLLPIKRSVKGSVQWKNDLGLYCSLVLVMNIGMCDLVILCLVCYLQVFYRCIEMYGVTSSSCTIGYQITCLEFLRVPGSNARVKASLTFVLTEVSS